MPRSRKKPGKSLEELVASIEHALAYNEKVSVQSPAFLADRIAGKNREHDVLITVSGSHHVARIAIECRDRSRKITVNDVEGFLIKCQDTGVDQGIVVSPKGFSKSALEKAKHRGIRCLQLTEAKSFNWLLATGIRSRTRKVLHTNWTFFPDVSLVPPPTAFTILTPDGDPIQTSNLVAAAYTEFQKIPDTDFEPGRGEKRIVFTSPGLRLRNDETGSIHHVTKVLAVVQYEIVEAFIPFRLHSYATSPAGEQITDAAVADVNLGGIKGKVMIVYKQAEGGHVVFVPEKGIEHA
ncbi:MAG TPA: restriction endonuclease [Nitrospira sp.]|nr:restriction endonuclease [Nitrospira sp.]